MWSVPDILEAIPSQEKLQVLAEWLILEPQVLRFGDHVATKVRASRKRWDEGIGFLERETFEAFLSLPVDRRKIVREGILALAGWCWRIGVDPVLRYFRPGEAISAGRSQ